MERWSLSIYLYTLFHKKIVVEQLNPCHRYEPIFCIENTKINSKIQKRKLFHLISQYNSNEFIRNYLNNYPTAFDKSLFFIHYHCKSLIIRNPCFVAFRWNQNIPHKHKNLIHKKKYTHRKYEKARMAAYCNMHYASHSFMYSKRYGVYYAHTFV